MENHQDPLNEHKARKIKQETNERLALKDQLLFGPEKLLNIRSSDDELEKIALKARLIGNTDFTLVNYVSEQIAQYESKFSQDWFYQLADLAGVDRSVMNVYVKPEFVRRFIISFVYARFPRVLLKELRSRNRKHRGRTKLFQYLKKDASEKLDTVIQQVYSTMRASSSLLDFKMRYSKDYQVHFQMELFN